MADCMLGKWDYSGVDQVCYSDSKCESYKKAAAFLGDTVEDWGCGTGWAKRYFKDYRGIDGSPCRYTDEVADLVKYTSSVDNILMRQVLELNTQWRQILENIKKSFKKKFCLIIYSPLVKKTRIGETAQALYADGTPQKGKIISTIYFNKQDILDYFPASEGYAVSEEIIKTNQGYGQEWILYIEKT